MEREEAEKLHRKFPETWPKDPYDCKTCKNWAGGILRKMRFCWKDSSRQPISLWRDEDGEPATALILGKADLHKFLRNEDVLAQLQGDRKAGIEPHVTCRGKRLCPAPLTWVHGIREALQWQADLDAWSARPFEGPTSDWPAGTLDVLRHVRGMNGLLQSRKLEKQTGEE